MTIKTLDSIIDVFNHIVQLNTPSDQTLVVFDLDFTLIKPVNNAACFASLKPHKPLLKSMMEGFSFEQIEEVANLALIASTQTYMEPETLSCFQKLKDAGFPVISLTATLSGTVGKIQDFTDYRVQELNRLGFVFSQNLCQESKFSLEDLFPFRGNYPIYDQGIIFGNGVKEKNTKGDILLSFLKYADFVPEQIVFIDDDEKNIQSMENSLDQAHLSGLIIHYIQCQKHPEESVSLEEFKKFWDPLIKAVK